MRLGKKIAGLMMLSMGTGMLLVLIIPKWAILLAVGMVISGVYFLILC